MSEESNNYIPTKHTLLKNTRYALQGVFEVFSTERAFRLELLLVLVLTIIAWLLPISFLNKVFLTAVLFVPLIVELLNSALERVVNLASPQYHELAKNAKDAASAAVFFSFLLVVFVWLAVIYNNWFIE
jgi:diacylglycerol kinase (ATP)